MPGKKIDRRVIPAGATIGFSPGAGNWRLRTFTFPSPRDQARGSILFLGGRADFLEKYLESFVHWHDAGWHVTSFDWRGQGGSGRLGVDPMVGHAQSFAPWINDLAIVMERLKGERPGPHVVIAHSMGGHLVLRAIMEGRIDPACAVLLAPMMSPNAGGLPPVLAGWIAERMCRLSSPERAAWKSKEKLIFGGANRQTLLTADLDRYEDENWWKSKQPELILGPPSWAWVAEAYRSTRACAAPEMLSRVKTPLLIIGTDGDQLVSPSAIRRDAKLLPNAELKMFDKGVGHEILRERDEVRDLALLAIDVFLDRKARPAS